MQHCIFIIFFLCFGCTGSLISWGGFSCSEEWAQFLCSMWVLVTQSGIDPTYPTLQSRFLTTGTPRKYQYFFFHLLVESQFSFLKYNVKYFRGTYSNQKLSHCYGLNICVGVGRSREAFWRLIILVFLRAVFCCIYVRTHPCREAGETSLSQSRTALHGATLCSIYSSLLSSVSKCIISFTGFSARIQKYLKVSVTLAFHLLPFPKQKKQIRQTHCLFVSISNSGTTIYRNAIHLCFHGCFQVGSDAVPLASSYLIQSLPGSSIFPYVLARSSLQLGGVPGTPQPK